MSCSFISISFLTNICTLYEDHESSNQIRFCKYIGTGKKGGGSFFVQLLPLVFEIVALLKQQQNIVVLM